MNKDDLRRIVEEAAERVVRGENVVWATTPGGHPYKLDLALAVTKELSEREMKLVTEHLRLCAICLAQYNRFRERVESIRTTDGFKLFISELKSEIKGAKQP